MKFNALILVSLYLISACDNKSESVRFKDEILEKYSVNALKNNDIELNKDEHGNYWYKVKDREIVETLLKQQTDIVANSVRVNEEKLIPIYEKNLRDENISYKTEKLSDRGLMYLFSKEDKDTAVAILHTSMNQYAEQ